MDNTIRKNEKCIIGLPACDFVFSSTRSCFIAYGYNESGFEKDILKNLLKEKGILVYETGGSISPGEYVYCSKICSKVITSQFCIVLLNNAEKDDIIIPNANVNMEYGLMLGFNKYVIPFQKNSQKLPFNVANLDTIKYEERNFQELASKAIDLAIEKTKQDKLNPTDITQTIHAFLLANKTMVTPLDTEGDKNLFELGNQLAFSLLTDFTGFKYIFFGNFTQLRPEMIIWRINTLNEIIESRRSTLIKRVEIGLIKKEHQDEINKMLDDLEIWVLVTSDDDKSVLSNGLNKAPVSYKVSIFTVAEVKEEVEKLYSNL